MEVANRFKGLDLIDRVPEELWMEVCDIVQEAVIKTIPKKKKRKKSKWLSEEALQKIFPFECGVPKIARRDKKAFLSDQCKEIEENNRVGMTRDLFKKIRDTKGTLHAKMGLIKDRNSLDQEEQKILRSGKNTQKNYTKKIY